jgi:hypothetical protein
MPRAAAVSRCENRIFLDHWIDRFAGWMEFEGRLEK